MYVWFQFQSGAVKSYATEQVSSMITGFNSKVVRLKGSSHTKGYAIDIRFNSKVVRLKVLPGPRDLMSVAVFQFQSGAVKSSLGTMAMMM